MLINEYLFVRHLEGIYKGFWWEHSKSERFLLIRRTLRRAVGMVPAAAPPHASRIFISLRFPLGLPIVLTQGIHIERQFGLLQLRALSLIAARRTSFVDVR